MQRARTTWLGFFLPELGSRRDYSIGRSKIGPYYSSTYDHRVWKTGLPVRSAVLKPHAGELVVGWVTTSESSLLYVFVFLVLGHDWI
ncbi:hypothetical protein N7461_005156 [Penicillium sp. DV-2018c]|nr:hypothetical protein N7461_005156 [Penicillium sp. DV-2018c]